MEAKSRTDNHLKLFLGIGALLAAALYNNWLAGPFLNLRLFHSDGSISEFSVSSQPYHLVFQSLDVASSLFIILLPVLTWKKLSSSRSGRIILIATLVLGFANIADSLFKLPCSDTLDPGCIIPVSLSLHHFQMPSHAYSSVIIAVTYLILPLAGLAFAGRRQLKVMFYVSFAAIIIALVSFFSALASYYRQNSLSVHASGAGQEIQMLTIGLWIVVAFLSIGFWDPVD